jgi:hypothetical protein
MKVRNSSGIGLQKKEELHYLSSPEMRLFKEERGTTLPELAGNAPV